MLTGRSNLQTLVRSRQQRLDAKSEGRCRLNDAAGGESLSK
jgi:hypothetical protein